MSLLEEQTDQLLGGTLLEEAMLPIDYIGKIEKSMSKMKRLLKLKKFKFIASNSKHLYEIYAKAVGDDEKVTRVIILTLPQTDGLDEFMNNDPSYIPKARLTNFEFNDSTKKWDKRHEIFHFNNANKVRQVGNNIMTYVLDDQNEVEKMNIYDSKKAILNISPIGTRKEIVIK